MSDNYRNQKPDREMTLQEKKAAYKGETFGGTIVDTSGENPILQPSEEAPNIIVNGEKAEDWGRVEMEQLR